MDYKETLNLLNTKFPLKGNLPKREPEIVEFWQDIDIYAKVREYRADAPKWVLHDGPPYANGNIHIGHALNKILKDMAIKYHSMRGFDTPYIPGWDTQGLPTEQSVTKEHGITRHELPVIEWRAKCRELALRYLDIQREQFKRLGIRGDWDNPYVTLSPEYQSRQIEAFAEIAGRGLLTRNLRPVYWCYHCETALAEDEIEYATKTSTAIYVAFRLEDADLAFPELPDGAAAEIVIWTTTPWTIPGNTAIALNRSATYVLAKVGERYFVVAQALLQQTLKMCGLADAEIIATRKGSQLEGLNAVHPFYDRKSPVVLADYVELESGTGCVHTAPGHGPEDYQTALRYNLEVISPLDDFGRYTDEAGPELEGLVCDQNNAKVIEMLKERDALLGTHNQEHEYPHCWRCHNPVIWRATKQWFINIDRLREGALKSIAESEWMPAWGEKRISAMAQNRPDWCISRQRTWGVPIPVFYCEDCGEALIDSDVMRHIAQLVRNHPNGADVWFENEAGDLLPDNTKCAACGGSNFTKEPDIMSVWFDSGASWYCVQEAHDELTMPADLYLEGDDQYQAWFQTSLWVATAMGRPSPFKMCVGHAFFVDETGQKMSKSKGNIISPHDIYSKYGADVLRMWFTYADFRQKMYASNSIIDQVADAYRKIRFTCRFMLQNLQDFDPAKDAVPCEDMVEVDKYALGRLNWLIDRMTKAFDNWDLHLFYHEVHSFCATDLSAFYINVCKDRLYTGLPNSTDRRSAQTALWAILKSLTLMMAPVLTFTSEEIWQHMRELDQSLPESVQLYDWPTVDPAACDDQLIKRWEKFMAVRQQAMAALEAAKDAGECENPLAAKLVIYTDEQTADEIRSHGIPEALFIVSLVEFRPLDEAPGQPSDLGVYITAGKSPGEKCQRCWMHLDSVGKDPRFEDICARCAERVAQLQES